MTMATKVWLDLDRSQKCRKDTVPVATIFFLFSFLNNLAFGQVSQIEGKFLNELPSELRPPNYSTVLDSVKHFELQDSNSKCSLFFISNDRYALSARHYFDTELKQKGLSRLETIDQTSVEKIDLTKSKDRSFPLVVTEPILITQEMLQDLSILRKMLSENNPSKLYGSSIVAIGASYAAGSKLPTLDQYKNLFKKNMDVFSGFVVIKLPFQNTPCVKTSSLKKGEEVFMVGFPTRGPNVIDYGRTISVGKQCEGMRLDKE